MEGHIGDQSLEFIIRLYKPPHSRLHLPTAFARAIELEKPHALRLHMRGYGNGSIQVDVDILAPHVMYFAGAGRILIVPIDCRKGMSSILS